MLLESFITTLLRKLFFFPNQNIVIFHYEYIHTQGIPLLPNVWRRYHVRILEILGRIITFLCSGKATCNFNFMIV